MSHRPHAITTVAPTQPAAATPPFTCGAAQFAPYQAEGTPFPAEPARQSPGRRAQGTLTNGTLILTTMTPASPTPPAERLATPTDTTTPGGRLDARRRAKHRQRVPVHLRDANRAVPRRRTRHCTSTRPRCNRKDSPRRCHPFQHSLWLCERRQAFITGERHDERDAGLTHRSDRARAGPRLPGSRTTILVLTTSMPPTACGLNPGAIFRSYPSTGQPLKMNEGADYLPAGEWLEPSRWSDLITQGTMATQATRPRRSGAASDSRIIPLASARRRDNDGMRI